MANVRVLIVGDDEDFRISMEASCQREHLQTDSAASRSSCMSMLRTFQPHFLVMNPHFQKTFGKEMLTQIALEPQFSHLHVLVLQDSSMISTLRDRVSGASTGCIRREDPDPAHGAHLESYPSHGALGHWETTRSTRPVD